MLNVEGHVLVRAREAHALLAEAERQRLVRLATMGQTRRGAPIADAWARIRQALAGAGRGIARPSVNPAG